MPTVLDKLHKGQVCQWLASDTQRSRSSCLSVTQNATRNKESSCLGHWESDTQHVPEFRSLFSTPQRGVHLPDHMHTKDVRTYFLQNPYPLAKYPHSSKDISSLPSDENLPFQTAKNPKGTHDSPFPKCRHSTLLVMEKLGTVVNVDVLASGQTRNRSPDRENWCALYAYNMSLLSG